jgi:ribosomal-protein-alanine N-acetyltransferase
MFESFETTRLVVRRMTMGDAQELTAISDVAEVSQWMSFMEGGFPLAKARAMIASQSERKETFFAVRLRNGALAGALGMVDHPDHAIEIGYWFGLDHQGNGYGYEAVRAYLKQIATHPSLAGRPIIAETHPDNVASIKLLAKAGFAPTGQPGHRPNRIGFALSPRESVDPKSV